MINKYLVWIANRAVDIMSFFGIVVSCISLFPQKRSKKSDFFRTCMGILSLLGIVVALIIFKAYGDYIDAPKDIIGKPYSQVKEYLNNLGIYVEPRVKSGILDEEGTVVEGKDIDKPIKKGTTVILVVKSNSSSEESLEVEGTDGFDDKTDIIDNTDKADNTDNTGKTEEPEIPSASSLSLSIKDYSVYDIPFEYKDIDDDGKEWFIHYDRPGISGHFTYSRDLSEYEIDNWYHGGRIRKYDTGEEIGKEGDYPSYFSSKDGIFAIEFPPSGLPKGYYVYELFQTVGGKNISDTIQFHWEP